MATSHAAQGYSSLPKPSGDVDFGPPPPPDDWELWDLPESMLLPIREVVMMIVMDRMTNEADWHIKVFDDKSVARWRSEVLSLPQETFSPSMAVPIDLESMISETVFDFCIAELQGKARYFARTGLVYALNAENNNVIKSKILVPETVRLCFPPTFDKLVAEYQLGQSVSEIPVEPFNGYFDGDAVVDPWLYPYYYGLSAVIEDEVVGVADAVSKWAGKGSAWPEAARNRIEDRYCITDRGQPLPSNVALNLDGTVRITSYVNNLHPETHASAYPLLEKVIGAALPAWEHALHGTARVNEQIVHPWSGWIRDDHLAQARFDIVPAIASDDYKTGWEPSTPPASNDSSGNTPRVRVRKPVHPEPVRFQPVSYGATDTLLSQYGQFGLQVIIKMTSFELTPEKPGTEPSEWQCDALLTNEGIYASAVYCVESTNIKPPTIAFRMRTNHYQPDLKGRVCYGTHQYAEAIYGTSFWQTPGEGHCAQSYGNVVLEQGSLVAYPSGFEHRNSPIALQDKTKPGRCRLITLWMVDPLRRAISTANVPPQQIHWWAGAVLGGNGLKVSGGNMPPELVDVVLRQLREEHREDGYPDNLPGAVQRLDLSERGLTTLTGGRGRRLPLEIVDMINQHDVLPDCAWYQPAYEGSPCALAVNSRQLCRTVYGMHTAYVDAMDLQNWNDPAFLDHWRSHWHEDQDERVNAEDEDGAMVLDT